MSKLGETVSTRGVVASEGAALELMSREDPVFLPTALRSPKPKTTLVREVPKTKKEKQKKPMSMHESLRKHAATQP